MLIHVPFSVSDRQGALRLVEIERRRLGVRLLFRSTSVLLNSNRTPSPTRSRRPPAGALRHHRTINAEQVPTTRPYRGTCALLQVAPDPSPGSTPYVRLQDLAGARTSQHAVVLTRRTSPGRPSSRHIPAQKCVRGSERQAGWVAEGLTIGSSDATP